jgi:hypothetical protein
VRAWHIFIIPINSGNLACGHVLGVSVYGVRLNGGEPGAPLEGTPLERADCQSRADAYAHDAWLLVALAVVIVVVIVLTLLPTLVSRRRTGKGGAS